MVLAVETLQRGPVELERTYQAGEIDARDPSVEGIGPLTARLKAHLAGPEVRIELELRGGVRALCARCLTPRQLEVARETRLIYHPVGKLQPDQDVEIHAADTEVGFFSGAGVDVEDMLREQILLGLPMRILCRDDCRGLCPRCGRNRNDESCDCPPVAGEESWKKLAEIRARR